MFRNVLENRRKNFLSSTLYKRYVLEVIKFRNAGGGVRSVRGLQKQGCPWKMSCTKT